jgi:hypothetical protein
MKLDPNRIKEAISRIPSSALGSTFFDDIEAFRSIMEYFIYREESLEGYRDDKTYLATFTRSVTLRITLGAARPRLLRSGFIEALEKDEG